jgi:non-ribosomal peptide synthetase component F
LEEWNETAVAFPGNVCIHELFEAQVARTPERRTLRFGEETLSYREPNEQANPLAHHLRSLGVAPGSLVGLCVNRGVRMLVGLVAILKAGWRLCASGGRLSEVPAGVPIDERRGAGYRS